jgi:HlyD family secretion protein
MEERDRSAKRAMIARLPRVRIEPSPERSPREARPDVIAARSLAAALALAALAAGCSEKAPGTLQGYVEGDYVHVASPYSGYLDKLGVARGAQVAAGAKLFVLEHATEQAAVDAAQARIRMAQAKLKNLGEGRRAAELDVIRAEIAAATTALQLSQLQLTQAQKLRTDNFVSQARLDEAKAAYDRDAARLAEAKAQMAVGLQSLGRAPEILAARAEIEAAQADLGQAQVRLDQKTGTAPAAALVFDTYYREGELVAAGSPVVSLLPPQNVKIRFFAPEPMLGALRPQQKVTIACDSCGEPIGATIGFISPQAEYTPPVIYSRESKSKLVYLVEAWPAPADAPRLRPGQPVEVTVSTP